MNIGGETEVRVGYCVYENRTVYVINCPFDNVTFCFRHIADIVSLSKINELSGNVFDEGEMRVFSERYSKECQSPPSNQMIGLS